MLEFLHDQIWRKFRRGVCRQEGRRSLHPELLDRRIYVFVEHHPSPTKRVGFVLIDFDRQIPADKDKHVFQSAIDMQIDQRSGGVDHALRT